MSEYDYTKPMVYLNDDGNMIMQIPDYMNYGPQQFQENDTNIINDERFNYATPFSREHIIRAYKLYTLPDETRDIVAERLMNQIITNINNLSADSKDVAHDSNPSK